ncbi:hypothetical protein YC2023_022987 [Brassica napus]
MGFVVLMPLEARFTDHTSFVEVTEQVTIPAEKFRFQKYDQLMALANTNVDLSGLYNNFELIL